MRNKILTAIFTLTMIVLTPLTVRAQQVSLAISPPLLEAVIKPGKSIMIAYTVQNFGDPVVISTKVLSFSPKDNFGNVRIENSLYGPIRFSLDNADLKLNQPFFMKSNDSQQFLLRIRVPDGAPNGDYYYTFLAETNPPPTNEGNSTASTKATIGTNILITVTDSGIIDVKPKVALFDVITRLKFNFLGREIHLADSTDQIPVVLIIENTGKNLFKPDGQIILKGNFGETASYDIVPRNILSESQRLVTATPSADFNCTGWACQTPISLILSGFFIGNYHLSTDVGFGENSPHIFANTSFIAIPIKFMLALLAAIIIVIFIVKRITSE